MKRSAHQRREDALAIWQAGVVSIDPLRLLPSVVNVEGDLLRLGDLEFSLPGIDRIVVVGGGKAGAGMAIGLENALGKDLLTTKLAAGLISVPADCLATQPSVIELVAGRPAGVNEPRAEGAAAAERMLGLVGDLGPRDLAIVLLSGGGSALLPAPVEGVSLEQKAAVTRLLSGAGATINQLNAVRKRLSCIKGGGLARACRAGNLVTLIISDVLGDPLDVIASGPTVENAQSLDEAIAVFTDLGIAGEPGARAVLDVLEQQPRENPPITTQTHNLVIANNATAVDSAGIEAERRGYSHAMLCATESEGAAEQVGRELARMALHMRDTPGPDCLITGGEPTVTLADTTVRGRGGRNQQLALAAMQELGDSRGVALLSGGTDGEDGPTDAAGAWVDEAVVQAAAKQGLDVPDHLARNDAYPFFEQAGGLLKTGPTGSNVCDVRVVTVSQP